MISTEDDFKEQQMDQDSDCWESLGQLIKTNSLRFLRQVLRINKVPKIHEENSTSPMIHSENYSAV